MVINTAPSYRGRRPQSIAAQEILTAPNQNLRSLLTLQPIMFSNEVTQHVILPAFQELSPRLPRGQCYSESAKMQRRGASAAARPPKSWCA